MAVKHWKTDTLQSPADDLYDIISRIEKLHIDYPQADTLETRLRDIYYEMNDLEENAGILEEQKENA